MWIELTEEKFQEQLSGPEAKALQTAALGTGQPEPLGATLAKVVQQVRGYIAANPSNRLAEGSTIPAELESAAIAIVRYIALNRLPVKSLLTDTRVGEYKDALAQLRDVAAGRFAIEQPARPSEQITTGTSAPKITGKTRRFTRADAEGI